MAQSGTVTLLFTDLVNSTVHLQEVGDEAGQRLFNAHHKLITDAITENGGEELEWLGDGALAAFSSSADAVRCAIKIQQTARRPIEGIRLDIRIGIHVGELLRRGDGYFGTPIVVARRLCDRASEGQILCSSFIVQLLSGRQAFNFNDLGDFNLKGITTPTRVAEVVYERDDPSALITRTPFVGRTEHLRRLSKKLDAACEGQGAVALLTGEPGIGKTRTLDELAELARHRGAKILRGTCLDGDWQRPCAPFAEAIMEYAREASAEEVQATLKMHAPILARIVPSLRDLIPDIAEPPQLDREEERFRLLDAVAQSLIAIASGAPMLLILDDLHWADRGTVAMLSHVSHFVPENPILMVGAYRESDIDAKHALTGAVASIRRLKNFESIALKGLDQASVDEMLTMIGSQAAPSALVESISKETGGNPFFIRELLLHLLEAGKILHEGQGWTAQLRIEELGVPEGVRELVGQRLLRISDDARHMLSVGSAFHRAFSFEVAAAVAGLDESAALAASDEAIDARLVRPGGDGDSLEFSHAIIRHTLYSDLNPARRVRVHRQIAEQMERKWGERASEHAAELAYQFWRGAAATGGERGADYAIAAAGNAEAAYDFDEAAALLRIALEMLTADDARRARLVSRRALALTWTINHEEAMSLGLAAREQIGRTEGPCAAIEYCEHAARTMLDAGNTHGAWALAREGLRSIGERRDIIWASLTEIDIRRQEAEDPQNPGIRIDSAANRELYEVIKTLPREHLASRNFDPSYESRAEIARDPAPSASVMLMLAGDYRGSVTLQQRDAVECEQRGAVAKAVRAWADTARCHIALGDLIDGRAALDRAHKLSARMSTALGLLSLVAAQGEMHYATDEGWMQLMTNNAAAAFMSGPSAESKWASAMINSYVSYLLAQINQPDLSMQRVEAVLPALERGAPWARTYCSTACITAATLWMLGRADHSELVERNVRSKVLAQDFRSPMSDARLSLARLCVLQGRFEEAVEWFDKARIVLDEQSARPLRAIADFDQALMYYRRGDSGDDDKAATFLECAANQFKQIGMTGWLRKAQQLQAT